MRSLSTIFFPLRYFMGAAKGKQKPLSAADLQYESLVSSQTLKSPSRPLPLPKAQSRNLLVTSALPYINNKPHLGNLIGAVLSADVYARYQRSMGSNVLFICGTDQYGTASEVKALKEKKQPRELCDQYYKIHKDVYQWFGIEFDHFGRTSKPIHTKITQEIFSKIHKNGILQAKDSSQLHCTHCQLFLADRFVEGVCKKCGSKTRGDQCDKCSTIFDSLIEEIDDLKCSICGNTPVEKQTSHLYLKLTSMLEPLKQWLLGESSTMNTWPNNAKGITKGWLTSGKYPDRCITRDLKWGVKVPLQHYQNKVFYVWFQAPLGYISMTADYLGQDNYKKWWLNTEKNTKVQLKQFMGKDNVLFHSIIAPAVLKGTQQPWLLPSQLAVTEYLNYEGGKFSKSHNKGIFCDQCIQTNIPVECWRYYLLKIRPEVFDSEFSWEDFAQKVNKQLANSIGNMIQRVLKYSFNKYGKQLLPLQQTDLTQLELELLIGIQEKLTKYHKFMENTQLSQGLTTLLQISFLMNEYIGKVQFWKHQRQQAILAFLIRLIKVYSVMLSPFLPSLTAKVNFVMNCPNERSDGQMKNLENNLKEATLKALDHTKELQKPIPFIKIITQEDVERLRKQYGSYTS